MSRRVALSERPRRARRRGPSAWRLLDPRWYLKVFFYICAALLLVLPYGADGLNFAFGARGDDGCRIARVIDGDTVSLWCDNGLGAQRARLVGFDTPEKFSAQCPAEAGKAYLAEWYLRRVLATSDELKVIGEGRDRYDRRLVRVWVDGENLAKLMIDAGHARRYRGGARGGWC